MTAQQALANIEALSQAIFFRLNFDGEWIAVTNAFGIRVIDMDEAMEICRKQFGANNHFEISKLSSALQGHGERDNV